MPEPQITDAEFTNAGGRIEHHYAQRPDRYAERRVRTNPLSYRWMVDYYVIRRNGADHETAIREVERRMQVAAGEILPAPVHGRLRVSGRLLRDDRGWPFVWRFCTGFRLLEQIAHGREEEASRFLDWASETGFNGVRVLSMASGVFALSPLEGLTVLPRLLRLAADRGLYVEVVALADTASVAVNLRGHVEQVASIVRYSENGLLQVANEHYHITQDSRLHDLTFLASLAPTTTIGENLFTVSPAQDDEAVAPEGQYMTRHLDRSRDTWNMVRRVRELENVSAATGKPVINDEPIGAAEEDIAGRRMSDPQVFFTFGALGRLVGVGSTFHFEDGLHARLPGPRQQSCAGAFIQGTHIMPEEATPTFKNAGWADSPVKSADFTKVVRAYSAIGGTAGWTVLVGLSGDPHVEWQNGWRPTGLVDGATWPNVQVWHIIR